MLFPNEIVEVDARNSGVEDDIAAEADYNISHTHKHTHKVKQQGKEEVMQGVDLQTLGLGGQGSDGFGGGGILMGLILGRLLGGNGLFGGEGTGAAAINTQTELTAIMSKLATIEASVPYNEA